MSLREEVVLRCPGCGHEAARELVVSLSGERNPELVEAVLDGSFQRFTCSGCGAPSRVDRRMLFVDWSAGLWIDVQPLSLERRWAAQEEETRRSWRATLVEHASPDARAIAGGLRPRLVFGFDALREKVVAQRSGLSDLFLELLKLDVLRASGELAPSVRIRLEEAGEALLLRGPNGILTVPRERYEAIALDPLPWSSALRALETGPWVDLRRIWLAR